MDIVIQTKNREIIGKKVKGIRREGLVPGIVYGRDVDSIPVQMSYTDMLDVYRQAGGSTMIHVQLEEQSELQPAFIREVQRDVISRQILHVDLELVDLNRPITAQVPLILVGISPVMEQGEGVLSQSLEEVEVHCLPADVPSRIEVDVSGVTAVGQSILVSDLDLPETIQVLTGAGVAVVYVTALRALVEEEEEMVVEEGVEVEGEEVSAEEVEEDEG